MNKEIDLEKYQIRTDLIVESVSSSLDKIESKVFEKGDIKVTNIQVPNTLEKKIGKKAGHYTTIEFKDITDQDNYQKTLEVVVQELDKIVKKLNVKEDDLIMIIGLGNEHSTPDALGPSTIHHVLVTNHLALLGEISNGFRPVIAFAPGVMAQTGIETSDFIQILVTKERPSLVIVIDALASQSIERVNRTIQMTDTGISPGSGVGNNRKEISREIIGVPVLAIGVPTVVDAATIVSDTIEYMTKYFTYTKQQINNPSSKLIPSGRINYLQENIIENKEDDIELLGKIGTLNDDEKKQFIYEILTPIGYNLMVTPKEVDFVIEKLSLLLAEALNQVLHPAYYKNQKDSL